MVDRTFNTLFMLSSVDGKISTGSIDSRDVDLDFPKIKGISEGLNQYYEIEKKTDYFSLNTGRVMAKIGMNQKNKEITRASVNFVIVDNGPHLTKTGVENLLRKCEILFLVTTNKNHPAYSVNDAQLKIVFYNSKIEFGDLFIKLRKEYGAKRVTIQSGGTLNSILLREGLLDELSLVVAPALIGGRETSTLIDGNSLRTDSDLSEIKALKLKEVNKLENSYLHLVYQIIN